MAILQTCYCCSSLKQLSLVGGCFTLLLSSLYVIIYYGGNSGAFTMIQTIKTNITRLGDHHDAFSDDRIFWRTSNSHDASDLADNRIPRVVQGSIINPNGFDLSEKSGFYMVKSICDILVILSCGVLFIGLCQEIRGYLVPWIALNTLQASLSLVDTFSKLFLDTTTFEPKTAFIFTLTFLLLFAQIYFILGAISLFQENFQYVNNNHNTNLRTSASHDQMEKKSLVQNKNCQHSSTMYIPMKVLFGGKTILAEDSSQLPTSKVIPTLTLRSPNHGSMRKLASDEEAGLRKAKRRLTINRRLTSNTKLEVIQETNMACSSTSDCGYEANELEPCENAREASRGQNTRDGSGMGCGKRLRHSKTDERLIGGRQSTPFQLIDSCLSDENSLAPSMALEIENTPKLTHNTSTIMAICAFTSTTTDLETTKAASNATDTTTSTTITTTNTTNCTGTTKTPTIHVATSLPTTVSTVIKPQTKSNLMHSTLPKENSLPSMKISTNSPIFWPNAKLVLKYIAGNTNSQKEIEAPIESNHVVSFWNKNVDPIIDDDFKDDIW